MVLLVVGFITVALVQNCLLAEMATMFRSFAREASVGVRLRAVPRRLSRDALVGEPATVH
jgi:hypothetical protein